VRQLVQRVVLALELRAEQRSMSGRCLQPLERQRRAGALVQHSIHGTRRAATEQRLDLVTVPDAGSLRQRPACGTLRHHPRC
jgi:hypothetical protein